jgi:DNA-binding NtrC family response regulator
MDMPEVTGLDILHYLSERPDAPEILILSGVEDIELAVKAIKLGAYDYLTKPLDRAKLLISIDRTLERRTLKLKVEELRNHIEEAEEDDPFVKIINSSPQMQKVLKYIEKISPTDNPVLIWGESGTGKELIARAIHKLSKRKDKLFVAINASILASELFASEFFGHTKGAFTGAVSDKTGILEKADHGTLFLDEIGDLSLSVQVKLLRVLQEGEFFPVGSTKSRRVDVRLITATNKDLQEEIQQGNFRTDLFYRLNVSSVFVEPLRKREGDIVFLAQYFLKK